MRHFVIRITGVVQGVGFRPMVHRIATGMNLCGTVCNGPHGVRVELWTEADSCRRFVDEVRRQCPSISRIDNIEVHPGDESAAPADFRIVASRESEDGGVTDVSPDIAICAECLEDMRRQARRTGYALTNCTHCGPRFSITRELPYDRPSTSMRVFRMCEGCRREYTDPLNRRFHAQPIACNECGPVYMTGAMSDYKEILHRAASVIENGGLLMSKSLGGYNIIADALNSDALQRLRRLKNRPRKPFAVMAADTAMAARYVELNRAERETLESWRAPIVVCRRTSELLPDELAPGLNTLGVMLPYMGFQHHLMELVRRPLAVTSANFPGMPIIADDDEAHRYAMANGLECVWFNREIYNRVDDSVVRVICGEPRILRRGRGYVPDPLHTTLDTDGIMATGADVTGGWALGRGTDIIASQYIGSPAAGEGGELFLRESIERMSRLYRFTPRAVAVDAHAGYVSTATGRELGARYGVETVAVWHHHAHAAAVIAEYGLEGEVLALVLDGTGAGPDGTVWGSELLRCSLAGFERIAHGPYLAMPGGDIAAREPWRMAVSLWHYLGRDMKDLPRHIVAHAGLKRVAMTVNMIERGINSPLSCGAGRLWDAVAALAGLCLENSYEAEAPVLLEGAADGTGPSAELSREFHSRYADIRARQVVEAVRTTGLDRVILTGGVIQNRLFAEMLSTKLASAGLGVYLPRLVTPGDGSIASGQVAIVAASMRER